MTPASIRNKNPGALYPGPSARKFGGTKVENLTSKDGKHKIAQFPTSIHGAAALFDNFMNAKGATGYYYRNKPLSKAIDTWCGSIRAQSYLRLIEQQAGYKPSEVLSEDFLRDPDKAIALARAMARHEAGRDYPLEGSEWLEAHAMAFGDAVAPEPSANNDVPTRRPEDRLGDLKRKVAGWFGVASAGTGTAVTAVGPPDLTHISAWKTATDTAASLGTWAWSNWKLTAAAAGVYVLIGHVLPWWAKR